MKKVFSLSILSIAVFALTIVLAPTALAQVETTDAFVCPVLNEQVGTHNPNTFNIADGDYSLIPSGSPHTIVVPTMATNGDGAGSPGGAHAQPGDTDYTAIRSM